MRYYLKPSEDVHFLKNKKSILDFDIHAFVVDVNFNYTTNRGNRRNKTERILYFHKNTIVKSLLRREDVLYKYVKNFFYNTYLKNFNATNPFRAIKDVEVRNMYVAEICTLDFDNSGFFIDLKEVLNMNNICKTPNNLSLYEFEVSYTKMNKKITKIMYSFEVPVCEINEHNLDIEAHTRAHLDSKLSRKLRRPYKYKGRKIVHVNDKVSNIKIVNILKTCDLLFV